MRNKKVVESEMILKYKKDRFEVLKYDGGVYQRYIHVKTWYFLMEMSTGSSDKVSDNLSKELEKAYQYMLRKKKLERLL